MASRIVKWAEPALNDLQEGLDFISSNDLGDTGELRKKVKDGVRSLQDYYLKGDMVAEYDDTTIRELLVGPFRIIYTLIDPSTVCMLAVVRSV